MCRRKLWRQVSLWGNLSIVRLLGILRDSWRAPEGEHLSLCRSSVRESGGGGSFSRDLEECGEEGSDRHHSSWGPHWGIWQETRLPGA